MLITTTRQQGELLDRMGVVLCVSVSLFLSLSVSLSLCFSLSLYIYIFPYFLSSHLVSYLPHPLLLYFFLPVRLLFKLMEQSDFRKFHEWAMVEQKAAALASYLIMPIQRIPRYQLLLDQLLKYTNHDHKDYPNLEKSLGLVKDVAHHINRAVHSRQNRDTIVALQSQFTSKVQLLKPSRVFIRQGPLVKQGRRSDAKYVFFLFNDMLAYASSVGWRYKLHRMIDIDATFHVTEGPNDTESGKFGFTVSSKEKSFVVWAGDQAEKEAWFHDITGCVSKLKETISKTIRPRSSTTQRFSAVFGAASPVMERYTAESRCHVCEKSVAGLFVKRRHCKACGRVVCSGCSKTKMLIEGRFQRVCDKCESLIRSDNNERLSLTRANSLGASTSGSLSPSLSLTPSASPSGSPTPSPAPSPRDASSFSPKTPVTPRSPQQALSPSSTHTPPPQRPSSKPRMSLFFKQGSKVGRGTMQLPLSAGNTPRGSSIEAAQPSTKDANLNITLEPPESKGAHSPHSPNSTISDGFSPRSSGDESGSGGYAMGDLPVLCLCRAVFDYNGSSSAEPSLSFCEGREIEVLAQDPSGWWYGRLLSLTTRQIEGEGYFPSQYVMDTAASAWSGDDMAGGNNGEGGVESSSLSLSLGDDHYEAIARYSPDASYAQDHIFLEVGDVVYVSVKDLSGWWAGEHVTTRQYGWFPADHVVPATNENEEIAPTTPRAKTAPPPIPSRRKESGNERERGKEKEEEEREKRGKKNNRGLSIEMPVDHARELEMEPLSPLVEAHRVQTERESKGATTQSLSHSPSPSPAPTPTPPSTSLSLPSSTTGPSTSTPSVSNEEEKEKERKKQGGRTLSTESDLQLCSKCEKHMTRQDMCASCRFKEKVASRREATGLSQSRRERAEKMKTLKWKTNVQIDDEERVGGRRESGSRDRERERERESTQKFNEAKLCSLCQCHVTFQEVCTSCSFKKRRERLLSHMKSDGSSSPTMPSPRTQDQMMVTAEQPLTPSAKEEKKKKKKKGFFSFLK